MKAKLQKTAELTDREMVEIDRNNMFDISTISTRSFVNSGSIPHGRLAVTASNANIRTIRLKVRYLMDSKNATNSCI